jgi:hypothetical protein
MNTRRVWMQLYGTALFELDADKVPDRVAEAALVTRVRQTASLSRRQYRRRAGCR